MREFPEINDGAPLSVDIRPKTRADQERLGKGCTGSLDPFGALRIQERPRKG
jgi:hypothetical protein